MLVHARVFGIIERDQPSAIVSNMPAFLTCTACDPCSVFTDSLLLNMLVAFLPAAGVLAWSLP